MPVKLRMSLLSCLLFCSAGWGQTAKSVVGAVTELEIWKNGNISFKLGEPLAQCSGWFILNKSDAGTKNQLALLLQARAGGQAVRVYTANCVNAENYGAPQTFGDVIYMYPSN